MHWTVVAARQGAVMSRSQVIATGKSPEQAKHLVSSGLLTRTAYRGVYRVAGAPVTQETHAWETVLATRSVLSYLSAATWWGLSVPQDGHIHITRPGRERFRPPRLVRVHRTLLMPGAVTSRFGLPITTRTETLLDCLGWLSLRPARDLLDRAFQQNWLTPQDIERRLDEQTGRWGNRQLARLLRESRPGAEAESERRAQRLLDRAGISGWVGNFPILLFGEHFRIDIAFPQIKLAIEIDGWAFHRSKERRDRDIRKANGLTRTGWRVLTFNWDDVNDRPGYFVDSVLEVLGIRGAV
jgi:very-short-patch-repair endonuclease